jgi:hypothetical protein
VHTDTNTWSVGIDASTGKAEGAPRRLTRGTGFVSHFSVSRDGNALAYFAAAFDATPPGGSPSVLVAHLDDGHAADESAWILMDTPASHPFWSRDGRLLYYLPTTPTVDIRNKVVARAFDLRDGGVGVDPIDVLTLSETIVPAMITSAAPICAGDQIVFLLGNYRGIWMMNLQTSE